MLPESFCSLPWLNLSTDVNGSLRPCCKFAQPNLDNEFQLPNMKNGRLDQLWNHREFQRLRQSFLDGNKPKECQTCWDEEASGILSYRQTFAKYRNIELPNMFTPNTEYSPTTFDLKLNNVCNLKCRICGPQASSNYAKEIEERFNVKLEGSDYWLQNKIVNTENEEIFKSWIPQLRHLEMTGGEPMTSPENLKILDMIGESGYAQNISILINTNGTFINKKIIDALLKFKHVQICLSVDDIQDRIEYQRYPCDWNILTHNIQQYKEICSTNSNISITLFCTVSNFNVFYLNEYLDWVRSTEIDHYWNILYYNPWLSIKNLPTSVKAIINNKYKTNSGFDNVLNFMNLPGDDTLFQQFLNDVNETDMFRKQSFDNTFPEWATILRNI
jgi:radical SAM protein with 4Fe4S-binding SPASM domain